VKTPNWQYGKAETTTTRGGKEKSTKEKKGTVAFLTL